MALCGGRDGVHLAPGIRAGGGPPPDGARRRLGARMAGLPAPARSPEPRLRRLRRARRLLWRWRGECPTFAALTATYSVSPQLAPADLTAAGAAGFALVDQQPPGRRGARGSRPPTPWRRRRAAAGLDYVHIPCHRAADAGADRRSSPRHRRGERAGARLLPLGNPLGDRLGAGAREPRASLIAAAAQRRLRPCRPFCRDPVRPRHDVRVRRGPGRLAPDPPGDRRQSRALHLPRHGNLHRRRAATVAVIDPGPDLPEHLAAMLAAIGRGAREPYPRHPSPPRPLAAGPPAGGGHRRDHPWPPPPRRRGRRGGKLEAGEDRFVPDARSRPASASTGHGWTLEALPTPGHTSNHVCYALAEENALFTGDHVMGWSTTVVTPPDGDMAAYMASLAAVAERRFATLWPTHGPPITNVAPFLAAYARAPARARAAGARPGWRRRGDDRRRWCPASTRAWTRRLHGAAAHSLWAHLIDLGAVAARDRRWRRRPGRTLAARLIPPAWTLIRDR